MSASTLRNSLVETLLPDSTASRYATYAFLALVGSLLLALSAKAKVPLGFVDLSLQTLVVFLIAGTFGFRLGLATVLLYMAEGAVGLPVFQSTPEKGIGLVYMVGPTGGFLLGFVAATAIIGWAADRGWGNSILKFGAAVLTADVVLMGLGFSWLAYLIGVSKAWMFGVAPFIGPELIKVALATLLIVGTAGLLRKLRS